MIGPILKAVKEVYTKPGKTFIFGPEGEMGGTVFYAPESYQKIVDKIREEYKGPANLEIALMFNHAYLPGVINRGDDEFGAIPQGKFWKKDGGWGPLLPFKQWPEHKRLQKALPAIHKLLSSVDVLGVSCYARSSADPQVRFQRGRGWAGGWDPAKGCCGLLRLPSCALGPQNSQPLKALELTTPAPLHRAAARGARVVRCEVRRRAQGHGLRPAQVDRPPRQALHLQRICAGRRHLRVRRHARDDARRGGALQLAGRHQHVHQGDRPLEGQRDQAVQPRLVPGR